MPDAPRKPKAIMLVDFQEEVLPTSRKLLHCIFQDRYSDWTYRWTPPWRDKEKERGVERLFFRAIEVEEWNDPKGVWDEELKKAAEEIPALKEFQLPVEVACGELATTAKAGWSYTFEVTVTRATVLDYVHYDDQNETFSIAQCRIHYEQFKNDFLANFDEKWGLQVGKRARGLWDDGYDPHPVGVSIPVWIPSGHDRQAYRIIGREVASFVRSYLRRVLGDYESLKRGFED